MGPVVDRDPRDDSALIVAYRAGDLAAFERLYRRHRDATWAFAWRFCRDHALCDDVVQECFAELVERIDDFELTGRLTSWLYVVAKRRALRLLERARRHQQDPQERDQRIDAEIAVAPDLGQIRSDDLRRVLRSLPAAQQETLVLRFVDGWSLDEIARALDVPLGTVKSRLHHAIGALRDDPTCRRHFDREEI